MGAAGTEPRPIKVLFDYQIFSNPKYGGIARYFIELAARFGGDSGARATVAAPFNKSAFLSEHRGRIRFRGVDVANATMVPRGVAIRVNRPLSRLYASLLRPDILHETYYGAGESAPKGCRVVTTIHDLIPERFPQYFSLIETHIRERRAALARADHVICVSESTRRDLLEFYPMTPEKISVIPLGSSLAPPAGRRSESGAPYFLHVGGRYPYKNFSAVVRAFGLSGLAATHKLMTFSAHPLTSAEKETMREAGVPADAVIAEGGDDARLASCYAGAVALVFPSMYEGFGIPLLEAMRCSCPIITSNTSSLPEVAGDAAVYCEPSDVQSIATAMTQLANSQEMRAKLIRLGLNRVQDFTWERCADETLLAYRKALA